MSSSHKLIFSCVVLFSTILATTTPALSADFLETSIVQLSPTIKTESSHIVLMTAGAGKEKVVELFATTDGRLFSNTDDLLALGLVPMELAKLPSQSIDGCPHCIDLTLIGEYQETPEEAKGNLIPALNLLPARSYSIGAGAYIKESDIPYQQGTGFYINYNVLGSHTDSVNSPSNTGFALLNSANYSFGSAGIAKVGSFSLVNADGPSRIYLGDSYFEHQFIESGQALRIGDSRTSSDGFIGGSRVLGLHLRNNRELQPEIYRNPRFGYTFQARAPGVVEIYKEGALAGSKNIDAGTVSLENLPPSRYGDIRLVVKNILGEEEVIYVPVFYDSRLIPHNKLESAVSIGALHGLDRTGAGVVSVQEGYGFLPWLSGIATGEVSANRIESSGYLRAGAPQGIFQLGVSDRSESNVNTLLVRGDWRNEQYVNSVNILAGASAFKYVQPTAFFAANIYLVASKGPLSSQINIFTFGKTGGMSLGGGWGRGNLSVGALVTVFNNANPQFGLRLTWSPTISGNPSRFGSSFLRDTETNRSRLINNAGIVSGPVASDVFVSRDFTGSGASGTDFEGIVSYDGPSVVAAIDSAKVSGATRTSLSASGSILADHDGFFITRPIYDNAGYAIVDAGIPGVKTSSNGQSFTTGANGKMAFPVNAYRQYKPVLELPAEADPMQAVNDPFPSRVLPGQKMKFDFGSQFGVLLLLANEEDVVTLNGASIPSSGFYAQLDTLRIGENIIRINGREFSFPVKGPLFGIYHADIVTSSIVPESTQ